MMTVDDLSVLARGLAQDTKAFVATYVQDALGGLRERIASLEAGLASVPLLPGPVGPKGDPGRDAEPIPGPKGDRGEPGPAGRDYDEKAMLAIVEKATYDATARSLPILLRASSPKP